MSAARRSRYIAAAAEEAATRGVREVLADIGGHLAPGRDDLPLVSRRPSPRLAPPPDVAAPELLGAVYEATLASAERRRRGAFYTPQAVAVALASKTLEGAGAEARVWDPAVGGGALLIAAARVLVSAGADPADVVSARVGGVDTDPLAVDVATTALGILGGAAPQNVNVGDGLARPHGEWDAVIANPPFRGQLKRGTARTRDDAVVVGERFGRAASGYADDAGLFLLAAVETVRAGGAVGFVLPAPLLATRDARGVREAVGEQTSLVRLWAPPLAFDAGVRVVLAVARKARPARDGSGTEHGAGDGDGPRHGAAERARNAAWQRGDWAVVASGADGPPLPRLRSDGTVGDVATVTADFRDQYYAVVAATREGGPDGAPVVTCGLIDPARLLWGERPARIGRRPWSQPRAVLAGPAAEWAGQRLVPKVMVATQTRVIEAAADEDGRWLPAVPVVSAAPREVDVWALLAALLAPAVSALARRRHAGAALSADAIKLSAQQVAALPLPADRAAWAAGADAARVATMAGRAGDIEGWQSGLLVLGDAMDEAYASRAPRLRAWWWERVAHVGQRGR